MIGRGLIATTLMAFAFGMAGVLDAGAQISPDRPIEVISVLALVRAGHPTLLSGLCSSVSRPPAARRLSRLKIAPAVVA